MVADDGVAPAAAVDARVGTELHVLTDLHAQLLRLLHHLTRGLVHQKPEPWVGVRVRVRAKDSLGARTCYPHVFCNTFCPRASALLDSPAKKVAVEFYKACCAGGFPTVVARSAGSDHGATPLHIAAWVRVGL